MIEITIMPHEKETMYQNSNFKKNIRGSLRRRVGSEIIIISQLLPQDHPDI